MVAGAGRMGIAMAFLLRKKGVELTVVDPSERALESVRQKVDGNLDLLRMDVSRMRASDLRGYDLLLSATPYHLNFALAELAIEAGCSFGDLGGSSAIVSKELELNEAAIDAGVCIVPDMGLAPGLADHLAYGLFMEMGHLDSLRIRVGGLPQVPEPPFHYSLVFSVEGLINEYSGYAEVLESGHLRTVPSLTGREIIHHEELGTLEAFHTHGGIGHLLHHICNGVRNADYKTVRYSGHLDLIRPLFLFGLENEDLQFVAGRKVVPRDALIYAFERAFGSTERDLVLLIVEARRGHEVRGWYLLDRADENTAMARCTAYPAVEVGLHAVNAGLTGALPSFLAMDHRRLVSALERDGVYLTEYSGEGRLG